MGVVCGVPLVWCGGSITSSVADALGRISGPPTSLTPYITEHDAHSQGNCVANPHCFHGIAYGEVGARFNVL